MTRLLSRALGAQEPNFSQSISALERAGGMPGADLHLTSKIIIETQKKISELGLDPKDTTGEELYNALLQRLLQDNKQVEEALGIADLTNAKTTVTAICKFLQKLDSPKKVFAIKNSVAKKMLRQNPPKQAMKLLSYRSMESMLKRESTANIYVAAVLSESANWHKKFNALYAKLNAIDFESRKMEFVSPVQAKWQPAVKKFLSGYKSNILCFREIGAIVLLPMEDKLQGFAITMLLLCLEYMNDIRSFSSYTKLQQVKSNFGNLIQTATVSEPQTSANIAGQAVSWKMIQRYYGKSSSAEKTDVFEPHVQSEDLQWRTVEEEIAKLQPALSFWLGTEYLFVLHEGKPVSMNIIDVALSCCNNMSFQDRVVNFVRSSIWHELMTKYLDQKNLDQALQYQLEGDMIDRPALAQ